MDDTFLTNTNTNTNDVILLHGDMMEQLPTVEAHSVDLVLLDLPYGQTQAVWDARIDLAQLWQHLKRIGKPTTAYIFFCTTKFGFELIKANEKWYRYDIVWQKNRPSGFLNAKKMPMRSHEMIYVFYQRLPVYNIADNHRYEPHVLPSHSDVTLYGLDRQTRVKNYQYTPTLPGSVLQIDVVPRQNMRHPTEKPIDLYSWLIRYYTRRGDVVLDVCFGSANSAVAAHRLQRRYIGIEKDDVFFHNARGYMTTSVPVPVPVTTTTTTTTTEGQYVVAIAEAEEELEEELEEIEIEL